MEKGGPLIQCDHALIKGGSLDTDARQENATKG